MTVTFPFQSYVNSLGMSQAIEDKVKVMYHECQSLSSDTLNEIFISEVRKQDNTREFLHLHFFSKERVFQYSSFLSTPTLAIVNWNKLTLCQWNQADFDLVTGKYSKASRVSATISFNPIPLALQLIASEENCQHLLNVLKTHILPKLV